jgi:hypothetical protein
MGTITIMYLEILVMRELETTLMPTEICYWKVVVLPPAQMGTITTVLP